MSYPAPSIAELAAFSGRDAASYGTFAQNALAQAALMFQFATGLTAAPDDPDKAQLARYAIMEMADHLVLEQPYAASAASPFQSETIGSYTYSKGADFREKVSSGTKLGLLWWDLAIAQLAIADSANGGITASGSIQGFDEVWQAVEAGRIAGPAEQTEARIGFWNADTSHRLG